MGGMWAVLLDGALCLDTTVGRWFDNPRFGLGVSGRPTSESGLDHIAVRPGKGVDTPGLLYRGSCVYYIRLDASRKTREEAGKLKKLITLCAGGRVDRFTGRGIMKLDTVHVKRDKNTQK